MPWRLVDEAGGVLGHALHHAHQELAQALGHVRARQHGVRRHLAQAHPQPHLVGRRGSSPRRSAATLAGTTRRRGAGRGMGSS